MQTFVLKNGQVHFRNDPSEREFHPAGTDGPDVADGPYQVNGDQITFWFPVYDNEIDRFTFTVMPHGDLKLTLLETSGSAQDIQLVMASKTWERIG